MTTAVSTNQTDTARDTGPSAPSPSRRTLTFQRDYGPLVVDVWEPASVTDAAPILLIHGWGGSGSYWERTAAHLASSNTVIVPDLPGTGRSQPAQRVQNMFDQVDVLADLLDTLELDRVQVVGHSMGGAMTLLLNDARPEAIERIVLTSLTFFLTKNQERVYRAVMSVFRQSMRFRPNWLVNVPGVSRMMAQNYFHRVPDEPETLRRGLQDYLELDAKTAMACAYDATDPAIPAAGSRVRVPSMLIACTHDQMQPPDNVGYTAEMIPGCQVRWMQECGHLPMVEKPEAYVELLEEFLELS